MKEIIIILLLIALIYYYRKSQTQPSFLGGDKTETKQANSALTSFLRNNLNSDSLEELKTKLGEKTLDELLEENEDYETEIDTLTRTKNSLEADLLAQSNAFQNRLREKDREVKKLKEDLKTEQNRADKTQEKLNSEKQINKGSLERINLLTKQVQNQVTVEEVDKLKEKLEFYTQNLKTKEGIIEEYKQNKQDLAKTLTLKEQNINDYKEEIKRLGKEKANQLVELQKLVELNKDIEKDLQKQQEVQQKIRELESECNKKISFWDLEKIGNLSQELSKLERERAKSSTDIQSPEKTEKTLE